jgi:hypothetical protein
MEQETIDGDCVLQIMQENESNVKKKTVKTKKQKTK